MIISLLIHPLKAIHRWRERHKAIVRLNALDDHLLRDIGIDRHDIPDVVAQGMANLPQARDNWPIEPTQSLVPPTASDSIAATALGRRREPQLGDCTAPVA